MIKAKDPRLQQIDVTALGFLNLSLGPRGVLKVEPIFQYKTEDAATRSQQATTEEEEKEEGGVVEVSDFEDDFEVFNQPQSLEEFTGDFSHLPLVEVTLLQGDLPILKAMGIQCKPKAVLLDVMESQSGSKALERLLQRSSPHPLHPFCLLDLILWTTREKGIKEALKQWKEGKVPSLRRPSSKGEPNRPR